MGRTFNKAQLLGNLTKDPDFKVLPTGGNICTFTIATNRSWLKDGEVQEETDFSRVASWGKLAELCSKLLHKGDKVFVEGRLQTRKLTNKEGQDYEVTEVIISDMILVDSKQNKEAEEVE